MKVNRLDAHDRLQHFQKQRDLISEGCRDCIKNRPEEFANRPFYIFAHARTIGLDERIGLLNDEMMKGIIDPFYNKKYSRLEEVPTTRYIWIPRLTKPKAEENSMLFKAYPLQGDLIKIIWIIPASELWNSYGKDKMTQNKTIVESIHAFKTDRLRLEAREEDDLTDEQADAIYREISQNAKSKKLILV